MSKLGFLPPFPRRLTMFSNALPKFCGLSLRYKYKINKWKYSKNSSRNTAKTELLCKRKYTHGHSVKTCFAQAMAIWAKSRALKLYIKSLDNIIVIGAFRKWVFTGFSLLVELAADARMVGLRGHWLLNSRPFVCNSCEKPPQCNSSMHPTPWY